MLKDKDRKSSHLRNVWNGLRMRQQQKTFSKENLGIFITGLIYMAFPLAPGEKGKGEDHCDASWGFGSSSSCDSTNLNQSGDEMWEYIPVGWALVLEQQSSSCHQGFRRVGSRAENSRLGPEVLVLIRV